MDYEQWRVAGTEFWWALEVENILEYKSKSFYLSLHINMLCVCAQVSSSGERGNESHVQTHGCRSAGTAVGWKVQVNVILVYFLNLGCAYLWRTEKKRKCKTVFCMFGVKFLLVCLYVCSLLFSACSIFKDFSTVMIRAAIWMSSVCV